MEFESLSMMALCVVLMWFTLGLLGMTLANLFIIPVILKMRSVEPVDFPAGLKGGAIYFLKTLLVFFKKEYWALYRMSDRECYEIQRNERLKMHSKTTDI